MHKNLNSNTFYVEIQIPSIQSYGTVFQQP